MGRAALLLLATTSITLLPGCGDPPPSTALAPDRPPMDMSRMSPEQLKKLDEAAAADRQRPPGNAPTGG